MTKEDIIYIVCEVCGTSIEEIKSRSIARNVAAARHLIAYNMCFRHGAYPLSDAAEELGMQTHSLYYRAVPRAIRNRRHTDIDFRNWYVEIEARLSRKTSVGVAL